MFMLYVTGVITVTCCSLLGFPGFLLVFSRSLLVHVQLQVELISRTVQQNILIKYVLKVKQKVLCYFGQCFFFLIISNGRLKFQPIVYHFF